MQATLKQRYSVLMRPDIGYNDAGEVVAAHASIRQEEVLKARAYDDQIDAALSHLEVIEAWHCDAAKDIFTSELSTGMSNNLGDYVWDRLLPYSYKIMHATKTPARSVEEIQEYIKSFSNTSNLLKHVFAVELNTLLKKKVIDGTRELLLVNGSNRTPISAAKVIRAMLRRAEVRDATERRANVLNSIIDCSFSEMLYALRQPNICFSIAHDSRHQHAITTARGVDSSVSAKLRRAERRFNENGEILIGLREWISLASSFSLAVAIGILVGVKNWAKRENALERVFDAFGAASIVSATLVAVASRKLDIVDLLYALGGKRRFITSYTELLALVGASEEEIKTCLTFEGHHLPPIAGEGACFTAEKHDGVFPLRTGLSSTERKSNIIIGNFAAVLLRETDTRCYRVYGKGDTRHLLVSDDALYRLVAPGEVFTAGSLSALTTTPTASLTKQDR